MADSTPNRTIDFAILIVGAARVVADRLGTAVAAAGVKDVSPRHGYVIRVLADRERTLTEIAELLDVSKQAAIKVVDEMQARGLLERTPDPDDRRVKWLRLTDKGRTVQRAALRESYAMADELRAELGTDIDTLSAVLECFLARHGALEDALARRSRALW
jgi:DNA-binding MarR family transcriptional regulator